MKELLKKYGHGLFALYIFIYLPWFFYLEGRIDITYNEIHCFIDDSIPFCRIFIIPYLLWFLYIVATCVFMFLKAERGEFLRFAITLITGMTTMLIICTFYPNCVTLRPDEITGTGILTNLISGLYNVDTSTNVFPSVHALNSIVACVALEKNAFFKKFKTLRFINITLCISICLSTMFLKQHSIIDVIGAIILYVVMYVIIYIPDWKLFKSKYMVLP